MRRDPRSWIALAAVLLCSGCGSQGHPEVLVLVNAEAPISVAIGEYYCAQRGIPAENLLALSLPLEHPDLSTRAHETISRADYESKIRAPVEELLRARGLAETVEIIVTTKGIPLRVDGPAVPAETWLRDSTRAAVDAELALLFSDRSGSAGVHEDANPYFDSALSFRAHRRKHPGGALRYLVARLTGYQQELDPETRVPRDVKALIDSAGAPAQVGLWLVDEDPTLEPAKAAGNRVLMEPAAAALEAMGLAVVRERTPTFASGVGPLTGYASWGSNAGQDPGPPIYGEVEGRRVPGLFAPRSLGLDFVSTNARSFTWPPDYGQSLVADLIRAGSAGSAGHVYEPTLPGIPRAAILFPRYAEGVPAAEAFYRSIPYLGWMNVYVGDPLMTVGEVVERGAILRDDRDGDGVEDGEDNCLALPNPDQRDTDADGFGNICDADVNNDGRVTTSWGSIFPTDLRGDVEWIALTVHEGRYAPDHDLDGDGDVDQEDVSIANLGLFRPPGPGRR